MNKKTCDEAQYAMHHEGNVVATHRKPHRKPGQALFVA
jgi:hypothetical protein